MDRRTVLKNLGLITGGAMLLPSCDLFEKKKLPMALNNLNITIEQQEMVAKIVAAIIPSEENMPGAADLKVQNFVWVMADDCMEEKDQQLFLHGLDQFMRLDAQTAEQRPEEQLFGELPPAEQAAFLIETMVKKGEAVPVPSPPKEGVAQGDGENQRPPAYYIEHIKFFLKTTKAITIQGYLQSQYIMTEVMPYQLVPGDYNYCKTIDPNERINING